MTNNEHIKKYIGQVRHELYHLVPADSFLSALQNDLEEYTAQFPESGYDDLVEQFGDPAAVAQEFLKSVNTISPKKQAARKKLRLALCILAICVVAILVYLFINTSKNQQGSYTDVITITDISSVEE